MLICYHRCRLKTYNEIRLLIIRYEIANLKAVKICSCKAHKKDEDVVRLPMTQLSTRKCKIYACIGSKNFIIIIKSEEYRINFF